MKVLGLVSYPILPAKMGGQKGIALFYKYLCREVPFVCVSIRKNQPALAEGYELLNLLSDKPSRYINPFYFFTLRKVIRRYGISHLELEHPYYGWLGVLLKRFTGVQLIVHSHNIESTRFQTLGKRWWKLMARYEQWTHRNADFNFFKTEEDRDYAIRHFGLSPQRCTTITYGIEWDTPPAAAERKAAREQLLQQHGIPSHHRLLLYNGTFNYLPNLNGLRNIVDQVNPALQAMDDFQYTILVCGKDIPADYTSQPIPNMLFPGFVPDIGLYFKGCDVFLNPVVEGGGIKTKLVEALGSDMNVVSTSNGAIGVDPAVCNGKLLITDNELTGFAAATQKAAQITATIPEAYFRRFYWGSIAAKAAGFIKTGNTTP
jgi:glycosyltransferase involved in cell wall biosynthesis